MARRVWVLLFWALVVLCFSSSQARIIRVPLDFPTIQEGLNAARDGDTVLVEHGVYRENIIWPGKSSIKLFANEQSPPDSTFLEPGLGFAPIITLEPAGAMIDPTTVIRGFVFRNGSAEDGAAICCRAASPSIGDAVCGNRFYLNNATGYGGAIACISASPVIVNNSFDNCTANYGGAIATRGRSYPNIRHNFIDNCIASQGGGIYCSDAEIIGNNLIYCRAHGFPGGALHIASGNAVVDSTDVRLSACTGIVCSGGSPTIKNSTIYANQRVGIYIDSGSTALVEGNLIEGNAGGIEIWHSFPTIRGNFIRQNDVGGRIGGGIHVEHGAPIIERNEITGNMSAYEAGGIYCCGDSSIIASNNISFNKAPVGAGVFLCCNSNAIVYGDTIAHNLGDGILIWDSQPKILNCLIDNNRDSGIQMGGLFREESEKKGSAPHESALLDSVIVENCTIRNNMSCGVQTLDPSRPVRITWTSFSGNRDYGVFNSTPSVVDARLNCWGHPTGPGGVGPGLGDRVSENVLYYPWLANGYSIASSSRTDPTAYNNSRKIVRDECPPYYKVFYTSGDGVWVTMTSDPIHGPWTDPIEIWPIEILHKSTHPAVAIEYNDPALGGVPYSKIHLVWAEHIPDETAPGEIYYAVSSDGGFTWSGPLNLSNSPDIASEHPAIAVDGTGVVHVVWEEQVLIGGPDIFYVNNSHGWLDPIVISAGLYLPSVFPTIASNYTYRYGGMPPLPPDDRVHIAWTEFTEVGPGEVPWIAYRSYDPIWGWVPPLDQYPEDATVGRGGAMASIIAYRYGFGQRAAAVVWQWPYYWWEDPPSSPCDIFFNARYDIWGIPTRISGEFPPDMNPSWYASLSVQAGPFLYNLNADTLWCVWEEWNVPEPNKSEIYSAYSPDCGQSWRFYLNLSQTPWDFSRYPSLAYQKGVTFDGLYDLAWTEIPTDLHLQYPSDIYYIGATSLKDSIYASVEPREPIATSPIVAISYPNPATDKVTFAVSITKADRIDLRVFDVAGREVIGLSNSETKAGTHLITWDTKDSNGNEVSPGVYWYVAKGAQGSTKGKIVILR